MKKLRNRLNERGSALLVTLMVMVGLSLLGLGFVTISETESAISVNERNYTQTLQVAEAGTRLATEWFNAPAWANANGLLPPNHVAIKNERGTGSYTGYYRETPGKLLFDYPFKASEDDRFFGVDYDSADMIINDTTIAASSDPTYLDDLNESLFNDNDEGGRITEIRIYAPPIVGGTKNTHNGMEFWNGGTRYGVATVAVTAEKELAGNVIARRTVKAVVSEFPFPGPEGPLQSNAGIALGGAFRVHWGKVISLNDLFVQRDHIALPWINTETPIQYEYGYAPSYYDPADPATYPLYLDELIGQSFEDPWFEARARDELTSSGFPITNTQPWGYASIDSNENGDPVAGRSGQFQDQDTDNLALNKKEVIFVRPVYSIWKQIALTGATQQGIYYLRYNQATGQWYDTRGESRTFADWVNVYDGGEEGFFFFDTLTGADPQNADGTTNTSILTPDIALTSSDGNPFLMRGFIYLNAASFGTQGIGAEFGYYNAPGEPFRDIGVHVVDKTTGLLQCNGATAGTVVACTDPSATTPKVENFTNYRWDFQDLDDDGEFDLYVAPAPVLPPGSDTPGTIAAGSSYAENGATGLQATGGYKVVPYFDGCLSGGALGLCSEPHEPYLNLIFQGTSPEAIDSGTTPEGWMAGWQDPANQKRMAKTTDTGKATGALVSCAGTPSDDDCTSNSYDRIGPMLALGGNVNDNPVMDGVLYNEGDYNAQGNAIYYGSILIWGTVQGNGNPDVWYDYKLSLGDWQDRFENLPRTIVTSIETDQ